MPAASLILALLLSTLVAAVPTRADQQEPVRKLVVTGVGEVNAEPDMATVSIGVTETADTARTALDANTAAMQRVMAALMDAGIAERDLQTSNFSIQPRYDHSDNKSPPKLIGYQVFNQLSVRVRELDRLGRMLDTVVREGSNQISGISFSLADPDAMQNEARRRAVMQARDKAALYAEAAGVDLGPILSIDEVESHRPVQPIRARMEMAQASDVPIARGELAVTARVTITWTLD